MIVMASLGYGEMTINQMFPQSFFFSFFWSGDKEQYKVCLVGFSKT